MKSEIVLSILLCFLAAAAQGAEVRLHSLASCSRAVVRLADIAEVESDDPLVQGELAAIPLFPAPPAGGSRQLDRHQVRQLLAISGMDTAAIAITGSESVVIESASQVAAVRPIQRSGPSAVRLASLEITDPASKPKVTATEQPLPPLVKKGEIVTVHSRAAGVRVTMSGKALGDGALGSEIAVELDDKRTKIQGRVAGAQTVEVRAN
jgi:Chaperone for flagella basal body P-ring formation